MKETSLHTHFWILSNFAHRFLLFTAVGPLIQLLVHCLLIYENGIKEIFSGCVLLSEIIVTIHMTTAEKELFLYLKVGENIHEKHHI